MKRRITQLSQLLGLGLAISLNLFSFANFRQAALSQSTNEFRTFMDWCLNQEKLSRGAKHTVQTLLRYVNTNDCQQATQEIAIIYDLNLGSNKITDISPLSVLTNLSELDLGGNKITDISPLSGLNNLSELDLGGNKITDISPLSGLTNLSYHCQGACQGQHKMLKLTKGVGLLYPSGSPMEYEKASPTFQGSKLLALTYIRQKDLAVKLLV